MSIGDRFFALRETIPVKTPVVSIDGTTYKWLNDHIYISSIPSIVKDDHCHYSYGLEARMGESFEVSEEDQIPMKEGKTLHEKMGESLGIEPQFDFRDRRLPTSETFKELDSRKEESLPLIEMAVPGIYKGIRFSGKLDKAILTQNTIKYFEEWKFANGGKIQDSHRIQSLIYAYFIYKWMEIPRVPYGIKIWLRKTWSKELQFQLEDQVLEGFPTPPIVVEKFVFTKLDIPKAESILDQVVALFTGTNPCKPNETPFNCHYCKAKEVCPHKLEEPKTSLIASLRTMASKLPMTTK